MPADHLLRKIDSAVDFTHIYEIVEDLYCSDNGIPSLRRTVEEIKMNVAYRWFLGYLMNEEIPHFSTISYNFKHRYAEKTIEEIFYWILDEINNAGYLSPEVVFVDGTHIKANANLKKAVKKAVPQAAKTYEKQLMEEINEDREEHDKSRLTGQSRPRIKKSRNQQQTRKAACFTRANTKNALRTQHRQAVTKTDM